MECPIGELLDRIEQLEKKVETIAAEVANVGTFVWTKEQPDGEVPDSSRGPDQEPT
jgi:hypothetical protein